MKILSVIQRLILVISVLFLITNLNTFADDSLSYTGRLANANGSPVTGPVDLKLDLVYTNDVTNIICTKIITAVPLTNGVFHLKINYLAADCGGKVIAQVLADAPAAETAAIRVTDQTNTKAYSFHAIHALPYAGVASLSKNLIQMGATPGQILSWDGTKWSPVAAGGTGSVTSVATGAGLTGGPITTTGTISVAAAGIVASMINQMGAASGNVLKWNGTSWGPAVDSGLTSESDPTVLGFAKNAPPTCLLDKHALHYDALLNFGAGGLYCKNVIINSDDVIEGTTKLFFTDARAKSATVADAINDAITDVASSQNAVFDALALKQNNLTLTSDVFVRSLGIGTNLPDAKLDVRSPLAAASGTEYGMVLRPTLTQSGTAGYTGLLMNVVETTTGSGAKKLIDLQVGGVSKFSVDATGAVSSSTSTSGTTANYTSAGGNQMTVGYDATNKMVTNVDSTGFTTLSASGLGAGFNFTGGNVGIGVAIPGEALDVTGSVKASVSVKAPLLSNATDLTITADSDNNASGALIFNTGANERIRVLNNGNVGIGTTTPVSILDIVTEGANGTTTFQTYGAGKRNILQFRTGGGTLAAPTAVGGAGANVGEVQFLQTVAPGVLAAGADMSAIMEGTPSATSNPVGILFSTSPAGTIARTERMRISSAGYVGIGTISPNAKLDVNGIIRSNSSNLGTLSLGTDSFSSTYTTAQIIGQTSPSYSSTGKLSFKVLTWGVGTDYGPTEQMYINVTGPDTKAATMVMLPYGGNVGIGDMTPDSKLHVVAGFPGDGVRVEGTGTSAPAFRLYSGATLNTSLGTALSNHHFVTGSSIGDTILSTNISSNLIFGTNSTENMRITAAGNVGIGTISPSTALDVVRSSNSGSSALSSHIKARNTLATKGDGTTTYNIAGFEAAAGNSVVRSMFNSDYDDVYSGGSIGTISNHPFSIFINGTANKKLTVDTSGNVGIGTTAPDVPLHVRGGASGILKLERTGLTPIVGFELGSATAGFYNYSTARYVWRVIGTDTLLLNEAGGNVGIGTTTPSFKLDVFDNNAKLRLKNLSDTGNALISFGVGSTTTAERGGIGYFNGESIMRFVAASNIVTESNYLTATRMAITSTGNVGIGTTTPGYKLQVGNAADGSEARANAWNLLSDERLKKDFKPIPDALDKLLTINGYFYHWNRGTDKARKMGVKAQEVEKVFPELISEGPDGFKSVSYNHLIAPVIEAVKQLYGKILALYERDTVHDKRLATIEAHIKATARVPASTEQATEISKLKKENAMMKTYFCSKDPSAPFCRK